MINKHLQIMRFNFPEIEEVNSFIISCKSSRKTLIIDVGGFDSRMEEYIEINNLDVESLFITHAHYDHIGKIESVISRYPDIQVFSDDSRGKSIKDGDVFTLGFVSGIFHRIPGHTDDMAVVYLDGHLFTGDSLFAGSVGGTSNEKNYSTQIREIKTKLMTYPGDTIIHPGHGPDSTIELEKTFNPFL